MFSPPVVSGDAVYETLIHGQYRLQALHTDTGREMWTYPLAEEK